MFNIFKNKVSSHIAKLEPSGKEIVVKKGENLLTAALSLGVKWPHKCRVGSCGSCKCKIIEGNISPEIDFGYVLTFDELNEGYALACQTALKTDIKVIINLKE